MTSWSTPLQQITFCLQRGSSRCRQSSPLFSGPSTRTLRCPPKEWHVHPLHLLGRLCIEHMSSRLHECGHSQLHVSIEVTAQLLHRSSTFLKPGTFFLFLHWKWFPPTKNALMAHYSLTVFFFFTILIFYFNSHSEPGFCLQNGPVFIIYTLNFFALTQCKNCACLDVHKTDQEKLWFKFFLKHIYTSVKCYFILHQPGESGLFLLQHSGWKTLRVRVRVQNQCSWMPRCSRS